MPDSDERDVRPMRVDRDAGRAPGDAPGDAQGDADVEPAQPEDAPSIPAPPDPTDPLKRDTGGDDEQGHPGIDPVTRPVPPE